MYSMLMAFLNKNDFQPTIDPRITNESLSGLNYSSIHVTGSLLNNK